jgi:hypothetical protein
MDHLCFLADFAGQISGSPEGAKSVAAGTLAILMGSKVDCGRVLEICVPRFQRWIEVESEKRWNLVCLTKDFGQSEDFGQKERSFGEVSARSEDMLIPDQHIGLKTAKKHPKNSDQRL